MKRLSKLASWLRLPAHDTLFQDVRYGLRILRRNPGFTAVAVLTLALGIGANTAVLSVVNAVLLRPLRFPDSARLMVIQATALGHNGGFTAAPGVFVDWRDRSTSFETIAGARAARMVLSGVDQPRFVEAMRTSFDFFHLTGAQPLLGRTFTRDEDRSGGQAVALLDAGFWRREFGGSPSVLGRTVTLDDRQYSIIGVLAPDIRFGYFPAADIWIPIAADSRHRGGGDVVVTGSLRGGVARKAAQAEMEAVTRGIGREHIEDSKTGVVLTPAQEWVVGDVRRAFLTLLGAVAFVLLICCANIANLMMARATARRKEMAIRATLGASRLRLVQQTLVESILLAGTGGALGLALAVVAVRAVPAIRAFHIPRADEIAVSGTMLAIAALVSLASGILFGLAPAFQIGRDTHAALQQGGAMGFGRAGGNRLRNMLVIIQLALALVLLSGAGLMANSFLRLLNIDLGFNRSNVLTIGTSLPYKKYDRNRSLEFQRRLMAEVGRMPGVEQVSVSDYVPLQAALYPYDVSAPGAGQKCQALARNVGPKYLRVMGIALLAGRDLETADDTRTPVPALISKTMAQTLFGAENPLGRHLTTQYRSRRTLEIVGVVGDARQIGLTQEPGPQLYLPAVYGSSQYVIARTAANAGDLTGAIRHAVLALDPDLPAPEVGTMNTRFSEEVAKPRFYLILLGVFAAAGVILAAVGIYGVMSYTIARRTREFGIRMALGAERRDILRLVLGLGVRLTCAGALLGIGGGLVVTRVLSTMLFGVRPGDPVTFGCVLALLAAIELLACYVAARRATKVDPNIALRYE